jgi:uncharacterized membrane protein YjfL (UPF0719 family)
MCLWSLHGLVAQLLDYVVGRVTRPNLLADVREKKQASAILLARASVAIGLVNATAMTG